MTVFSDCLTRLAGLFGGGPKPPDCCGDFGGGDGGGDDDDQDDDESCINSCVDYSFCIRSTQSIVGTTSIGSVTLCYDDIPPEIKITLNCDGPNGTFTGWPQVVDVNAAGNDALSQWVAGILGAAGLESPALGFQGGIDPGDCETFACDFGCCPANGLPLCPDDGCFEETVPNIPAPNGYFKCKAGHIGSPCRNDCDQVFNLDYSCNGTKYRTVQQCQTFGDCCEDDYTPPDPDDPVDITCDFWKCTPFVGCLPVTLTVQQLAALGWDFTTQGCPDGDPTPLINYYTTELGCKTNCPTNGGGDGTGPGTAGPAAPTTPPQSNICNIYECDDCESECTKYTDSPAGLNAALNLGLIDPQNCNDIFNSIQTPPFYTNGAACNNACKYDEEICTFSMCKDFQNPAIRRCVIVFNGARNIFNNINAGLAGTTIEGPDCPNCDSISDWIGDGKTVGNDRYYPAGGCVDCDRVVDGDPYDPPTGVANGTGFDIGDDTGGGGGGGANPFDDPTGTATGITFDGGNTGGGGGGGGSNIGVTAIDFNSNNLEDPTNTQSLIGSDGIRREYASYEYNRVVNPNLSNLPRVKSRDFIPITNRGFRTDIFGSKIHYAIQSIDQIMSDSIPYSDIPFSELTLANLKDSLSDDLRQRFDSIKSSKGGTDLINRILRTIKRKVFEGRIYDLNYAEIITLLDNFEDRDLKFSYRNVSEVAAVNHMIENARTIDVSKFSEAPREEIRLWKLVAPDVEKHLTVILNDGSAEKVFVEQDDSFELTLSDGTPSSTYIKDGDIYDLATPGYVPVLYDRDRTVVLDLNDTEKIFNMLGQDYSVVLDVSTAESADIEATASLTDPRQDVYLLKLDPTTIEDMERDNDLIRVTRCKYTLMDEADIDEWIQFKPFPFSTFYLDHEDPFFDHLESSERLFITSKDFALDSFVGYEDDLPILPRRLPWSVAIIATDRVDLQDGVSRSSLVALNRRSVTLRRSSMKKDIGTNHPLYDFTLVGKGSGAVYDAPTNNQMKFSFNKSKLDNIGPRIKADDKTRKASPVRELLTALRDAKTEQTFIDSKGTTVPWPVVYNKMSISARKRLSKEIVNYNKVRSKVSLNKLATNESIRSTFPKVSNVPVFGGDANLNNYTFKRRITKIDGSNLRPGDIQPL